MKELSDKYIALILPKRPEGSNKGTFGSVLVVAGSQKYPGAAYLSCAASYRVGAGLVTLATDETTKIIVSRKLPEVTFLSLQDVIKKMGEYDALLIGPGLEQDYQLSATDLPPTVIDAGGLKWGIGLKGEAIITPHPGEMSRLTGLTINEVQSNREKIALRFAKKWNKVVVLKGANTVIVSPAGEVRISPFANPALATAGTGDVLAGVIAGLSAQGLNLFDAACTGVYLHGLAGEMVRKNIGVAGALAGDLLLALPQAIKKLSNQHSQT